MRSLKLNNAIIFHALCLTKTKREEVYAEGTAMPLRLRTCQNRLNKQGVCEAKNH